MKHAVLAAVGLSALLAPATSRANSFTLIDIEKMTHRAPFVYAYDLTEPFSTPVMTRSIIDDLPTGGARRSAAATADWLTRATSSPSSSTRDERGGASRAEFKSSPLTDGIGSPNTQGFADLFDVTADDQDVWRHTNGRGTGVPAAGIAFQPTHIPLVPPITFSTGHLHIPLDLLVDVESYEVLTSKRDLTSNGIGVSSLVNVPDQPSSLLLLGTALVMLGTFRRFFRRAQYQ